MQEIKSLTALRGIFALWVVAFHLTKLSPLGPIEIPIVSRGYLAVDFFFTLSGYVMAGAYGADFENVLSARTYSRFIIKRIGRLFPLHLSVMAITLFVAKQAGIEWPWWTYLVEENLLVHRWGFIHAPAGAVNGPDWALSVEFAAVLLFPIFVLLTLRSRVLGYLIVATSVMGLFFAAKSAGWSLDIAMADSYWPLIRCFCEIAIGMVAYRNRAALRFLGSDAVISSIMALLLVLTLVPLTDLLIVSGLILIVPALANNSQRFANALSYPVFATLGPLSFAIYLLQIPVISAAGYFATQFSPFLQAPVFTVAFLVGMFVFVPLAHREIELLGRRYTDQLLKRL